MGVWSILIKILSYKSNPLCCVEAIWEQFNEETFALTHIFLRKPMKLPLDLPLWTLILKETFSASFWKLWGWRQWGSFLEIGWNFCWKCSSFLGTPHLGEFCWDVFRAPPSVGSECCSPYPLLCSALVLYICSSATLICSSAEDLFLCSSAEVLFLCPSATDLIHSSAVLLS